MKSYILVDLLYLKRQIFLILSFVSVPHLFPRKKLILLVTSRSHCNIFQIKIQGYTFRFGIYLQNLKAKFVQITLGFIEKEKKKSYGSARLKHKYAHWVPFGLWPVQFGSIQCLLGPVVFCQCGVYQPNHGDSASASQIPSPALFSVIPTTAGSDAQALGQSASSTPALVTVSPIPSFPHTRRPRLRLRPNPILMGKFDRILQILITYARSNVVFLIEFWYIRNHVHRTSAICFEETTMFISSRSDSDEPEGIQKIYISPNSVIRSKVA